MHKFKSCMRRIIQGRRRRICGGKNCVYDENVLYVHTERECEVHVLYIQYSLGGLMNWGREIHIHAKRI